MARRKTSKPAPNRAVTSDIDIVIPVYGNPEGLKACLAGVDVAGLSVKYMVYIVDDQSPEDSRPALEAIYATLAPNTHKLIRNSKNLGFPYTANKGASEGLGKYILFLNTDVVLDPGALREIIKTFEMTPAQLPHSPGAIDKELEHAGVGAVSPKLLFSDDSPHGPPGHVQHAGMYFRLDGMPMHAFLGWAPDNPRVNVMRSIQAATGACLAVRRDTWNLVTENLKKLGDDSNGAFSLAYGRGTFEDVELCLSVRGVGYKVIYQPSVVASHVVGASSANNSQGFNLHRNRSIFGVRAGHLVEYDHWAINMWPVEGASQQASQPGASP